MNYSNPFRLPPVTKPKTPSKTQELYKILDETTDV